MTTIIPHQSPFALSLCGHFVVERHPGEIYPNVMTISEARSRQRRAEINAAHHERGADQAAKVGLEDSAQIDRAFASLHLTIAADIAEVLNDVSGCLSDGKRSAA